MEKGRTTMHLCRTAAIVVAACGLNMWASHAYADAIDGQWCLASSHFAIEGPNILTPGGNRIVGNYSRHGFTYVVPANELGAGTEIVMVLFNEETVQLTRSGSAPETWRRCKPTS
jgi:hypothetical protein